MKVVVVIPCQGAGDSDEYLMKTLEHMYYPNPKCEHYVIVVDDNPTPVINEQELRVKYPQVRVVASGQAGCAGSRDYGIEHSPVPIADDDILVFLDAHMNPNLYQDVSPGNFMDKICAHLAIDSNRILCGKCFALDRETWYAVEGDVTPVAYGAELLLLSETDVLEPRWIDTNPSKLPPYFRKLSKDPLAFHISLIHGACYGINAGVFRYLEGFTGLEDWGSDEVYLSLKAYIAGPRRHQCGVMQDVRVGHLFNPTGAHPERRIPMIVNKFRVVKELFPSYLVDPYIELIRMKEKLGNKAYEEYKKSEPEIEKRRQYWIEKFTPARMESWLRKFEQEFHSPRIEKALKANTFLKKFTAVAHKPSKVKALYSTSGQFKAMKLTSYAAEGKPTNTVPPGGIWP